MAQPRILTKDRFFDIASKVYTQWLSTEARDIALTEDEDARFAVLTEIAVMAVDAAAAFETAYCSEE